MSFNSDTPYNDIPDRKRLIWVWFWALLWAKRLMWFLTWAVIGFVAATLVTVLIYVCINMWMLMIYGRNIM